MGLFGTPVAVAAATRRSPDIFLDFCDFVIWLVTGGALVVRACALGQPRGVRAVTVQRQLWAVGASTIGKEWPDCCIYHHRECLRLALPHKDTTAYSYRTVWVPPRNAAG